MPALTRRTAVSALSCLLAAPADAQTDLHVRILTGSKEVDVFDFTEMQIRMSPTSGNPFTDTSVTAEFDAPGGLPIKVDGFCDSHDGALFRLRFMPVRAGEHQFRVTVRRGNMVEQVNGSLSAVDAGRRGPIAVDPQHPYHFVYRGTGEHWFWNGTTTYWLLGWEDESIIRAAIDRLAKLGVTRIRVSLQGRTTDGTRWDEPLVVNTEKYRFRLNPWPAARPENVEDPGFDVTRFNLPFWQKCDRMLAHAKKRGVQVSLIYFLDGADKGADPFGKARAGCPEEKAYYRYTIARCAAYSNVMWDVSNEYHLFRTEPWVEEMGALVKATDPYGHLASVHGSGTFPFRTSRWADYAMYQQWDEAGGHNFMLRQRDAQHKTGRPMPQINEEYGYEDHYPTKWGGARKPPARNAENRRRLAWGMVMAGGYQTTGERADQGTGKGPDTGGGWINGRGDTKMTMLVGYKHIVTFLTGVDWWKTEPDDARVTDGAMCLAESGRVLLVYLPDGKPTTVRLEAGTWRARWFNCRTGVYGKREVVRGPQWTCPKTADTGDWAIEITRE